MNIDNIICASCHKYNYCKEYESLNRPKVESSGIWRNLVSPIRKCQIAICELYYTKIFNKAVLEVGCGNKKKGGFTKEIVESNNCTWVGIDIKRTDLVTHVCSVTSMPFEDNSFDCVIGNQTLEHWKKPRKALKEVRRVLRPGGKAYLTAPIHLHGGDIFVRGDFNSIEKLFVKIGFDIEKFETWRKDFCDLEPYLNIHAKKHLRRVGIANYEGMTSYIIHCILSKSKDRVKFWQNKKHL